MLQSLVFSPVSIHQSLVPLFKISPIRNQVVTMTTPSYDTFQNQYDGQGAGGAGAGAPPQQDSAMGGQLPDNSQGQFQAGNGDPGSAGGQAQGTDAKTTLWYVSYFCFLKLWL